MDALARSALLNNFAVRSFRDVADGDYIAARLSFRSQLIPQFLWQSLQAIEKYLKCILVLNRIKAPSRITFQSFFVRSSSKGSSTFGFQIRLAASSSSST